MKFIRVNDRVINKDHITSITFSETEERFPDSVGCDGLLIATIWYDGGICIEYKVRIECFIRWGVHKSSYYLDEFMDYVCRTFNDDRICGIQDCVEKSND